MVSSLFVKIGDFLEFETRLGSSLQRMLLILENFRMGLALPHEEEDVVSVQKLTALRGSF